MVGLEAQKEEPNLPSSLAGLSATSIGGWGSGSERHSSRPIATQPVHGRARTHIGVSDSKPLSLGTGPCSPATLTLGARRPLAG